MTVRISGLYGLDNHEAYYRKLGDCFDFVHSVEYASDLTEEEVDIILAHKDWYLKMYNAKEMIAY